MSKPDRERMDVISEALARLVAWQRQTDARLARIEQALGLAAIEPESTSERDAPAPLPLTPEAEATPPPLDAPRQVQPHGPRALETSVGLTWLNRIGVLTFVLGVAFFFKYAVDNRWIGETGRVGLGVAGGLAALAVAERFWRIGHTVYAQGICGGGIAMLYLSLYAAFGFYHLIGAGAAFLLMTGVTAGAGALSLRYNAAAIAGMALLGGYATPILLSSGEDRPWFLFSYMLLLAAASVAIVRLRGWRWLEVVAFAATACVYVAWFDRHFAPEKRVVATVFPLAFYGLFAVRRRRGLAIAAQVLVSLALLAVWAPPRLTYLLLSLAVAIAGLVVADRRNWTRLPFAAVASFWFFYGFWQLDLRQTAPVGVVFLLLTAAFLQLLAWLPWRAVAAGAMPDKESLVLAAGNAAAYFGFCYSLPRWAGHDYRGALAVALAALHLALAGWFRKRASQRAAALLAGVGVAFVTLAIPIQLSAYRITIGWALEGAALAWIAARFREHKLCYGAAAVFAGVVLRLLIVDAVMYPQPAAYAALFNARFLTFLVAAASLVAAAWWTGAKWPGLAAYLAGHFVMLWGLILEAMGWAARTAAPENLRSVETAAVSILLAAYAAALVTAGALTGFAVNRVLGLGLIGLVVLKLYLYDVWLLGRFYRIWAFAVLGALLLAVSFIYSRYRSSLESWWRRGGSQQG
ncbi:MAG: DUF2339 domain-containing protein [Bryobacteraceae bacterium]|nr:DUF2339 domain-containing protein [Bryobacteraceae bacterium]